MESVRRTLPAVDKRGNLRRPAFARLQRRSRRLNRNAVPSRRPYRSQQYLRKRVGRIVSLPRAARSWYRCDNQTVRFRAHLTREQIGSRAKESIDALRRGKRGHSSSAGMRPTSFAGARVRGAESPPVRSNGPRGAVKSVQGEIVSMTTTPSFVMPQSFERGHAISRRARNRAESSGRGRAPRGP